MPLLPLTKIPVYVDRALRPGQPGYPAEGTTAEVMNPAYREHIRDFLYKQRETGDILDAHQTIPPGLLKPVPLHEWPVIVPDFDHTQAFDLTEIEAAARAFILEGGQAAQLDALLGPGLEYVETKRIQDTLDARDSVVSTQVRIELQKRAFDLIVDLFRKESAAHRARPLMIRHLDAMRKTAENFASQTEQLGAAITAFREAPASTEAIAELRSVLVELQASGLYQRRYSDTEPQPLVVQVLANPQRSKTDVREYQKTEIFYASVPITIGREQLAKYETALAEAIERIDDGDRPQAVIIDDEESPDAAALLSRKTSGSRRTINNSEPTGIELGGVAPTFRKSAETIKREMLILLDQLYTELAQPLNRRMQTFEADYEGFVTEASRIWEELAEDPTITRFRSCLAALNNERFRFLLAEISSNLSMNPDWVDGKDRTVFGHWIIPAEFGVNWGILKNCYDQLLKRRLPGTISHVEQTMLNTAKEIYISLWADYNKALRENSTSEDTLQRLFREATQRLDAQPGVQSQLALYAKAVTKLDEVPPPSFRSLRHEFHDLLPSLLDGRRSGFPAAPVNATLTHLHRTKVWSDRLRQMGKSEQFDPSPLNIFIETFQLRVETEALASRSATPVTPHPTIIPSRENTGLRADLYAQSLRKKLGDFEGKERTIEAHFTTGKATAERAHAELLPAMTPDLKAKLRPAGVRMGESAFETDLAKKLPTPGLLRTADYQAMLSRLLDAALAQWVRNRRRMQKHDPACMECIQVLLDHGATPHREQLPEDLGWSPSSDSNLLLVLLQNHRPTTEGQEIIRRVCADYLKKVAEKTSFSEIEKGRIAVIAKLTLALLLPLGTRYEENTDETALQVALKEGMHDPKGGCYATGARGNSTFWTALSTALFGTTALPKQTHSLKPAAITGLVSAALADSSAYYRRQETITDTPARPAMGAGAGAGYGAGRGIGGEDENIGHLPFDRSLGAFFEKTSANRRATLQALHAEAAAGSAATSRRSSGTGSSDDGADPALPTRRLSFHETPAAAADTTTAADSDGAHLHDVAL